MKYSEGDYVVHPGQGVCQVVGVEKRTAVVGASADDPGHEETILEYKLSPLTGAGIRIHFPVSKEGDLRDIISPEAARDLIRQAPSLKPDDFDKQQSWTIRDHFMECLREGDTRETMRVAKTVREHMEQAARTGRKPRECYSSVYQAAHSRLLDELSISLKVSRERIGMLLEECYASAADCRVGIA